MATKEKNLKLYIQLSRVERNILAIAEQIDMLQDKKEEYRKERLKLLNQITALENCENREQKVKP